MSKLEELRVAAGLTRNELAFLAKTSYTQILRLERDPGDKSYRKMTKAWAERLAPFVNATPIELLFEHEAGAASVAENPARESISPPPKEAPKPRKSPKSPAGEIVIYGGAAVIGADYSYVSRKPFDRIARPAGIAHRTGVYAVHVIGREMEPRFKDGDLVFVDAEKPPANGDDVVIDLVKKPNELFQRRYFRQLVSYGEKTVKVRKYTPASDHSIKTNEISTIHRIIPYRELLGL